MPITAKAAKAKIVALLEPIADVTHLFKPWPRPLLPKVSKASLRGHGSSRLATPSPNTATRPNARSFECGSNSPAIPRQRGLARLRELPPGLLEDAASLERKTFSVAI